MIENKKIETLKDILKEKCEVYKDNIAFLEKDTITREFREIKYSEFKEDVVALGTALIDLGLKDEKIIVFGENSYKWITTYMAVTCGVGIIVPIDKELPQNEIVNLINRSNAKAIVYSSRRTDKIEAIKDEVPNIKCYIEMDKENSDDVSLSYDKLVESGKKSVLSGNNTYMDIKIDKRAFKILLFTSGTTSNAKGVMLCHENVATSIYAANEILPLVPEDRFFSLLPIHHTYELTGSFMYPLTYGASIGICEGLKYIAKDIALVKPTAMMVVPAVLELLNKSIQKGIEEQGKSKLVKMVVNVFKPFGDSGKSLKRKVFKDIYAKVGGRLKYVFCGAAPIDKDLAQKFEDLGLYFLQGFGLTETAPLITGTYKKGRVIGSVGKEIPFTETKILNPNEDGIGEIITKGTHVMLGYYENEEETNRVVKDGWFNTEDLGYMDKEGNFYVSGRTKNVIIASNGKNVYPEEIENIINQIPLVKESLVYAKDEKGQKDIQVAAMVTIDEEYLKEKYGEEGLDKEKIYDIIWKDIKVINSKLVSYKAVKHLEIKDEDFIKTTTLKIKRFEELKKLNNN